MNIFNRFKKVNRNIKIETKPLTVYQPVEGIVSPIKTLNDGVFSEGILGQGCSIKPINQIVYAPFDGVVETVAETNHAIGLKSDDGLECLIHIGIDTVDMNGKGFKVYVHNGQKIKAGELLMEFSIETIQKHGHLSDVIVVITNTNDYKDVILSNHGTTTPLKTLLEAIK